MREPLLKDIEAVKALMEKARSEDVGERLAAVLKDIVRNSYADATATTSDTLIGRPEIYVRPADGIRSVRFKLMDPRTRSFTGPRVDIDALGDTIRNPGEEFNAGQLRWDALCSIKNMLIYNCNEIEGL